MTSFKEYLTEATPTLVKSITGVKASDRHKFESDLEKAVIGVFTKYKNLGS